MAEDETIETEAGSSGSGPRRKARPGTDGAACGLSVELVRDAQGGDGGALNELLDRYQDRVRYVIRMRMGPHLRQTVESGDILQEVLISAIMGFERFEMRHERSFLNWLAAIAENKIRDAVDHAHAGKRDVRRERSLEPRRRADQSGDHAYDLAGVDLPPGDQIDNAELLELLAECVHELPELQRRAFVLRHFVFEAPDWAAIAEELGSPSPDAARMTWGRATVTLSKLIERRRQRR